MGQTLYYITIQAPSRPRGWVRHILANKTGKCADEITIKATRYVSWEGLQPACRRGRGRDGGQIGPAACTLPETNLNGLHLRKSRAVTHISVQRISIFSLLSYLHCCHFRFSFLVSVFIHHHLQTDNVVLAYSQDMILYREERSQQAERRLRRVCLLLNMPT